MSRQEKSSEKIFLILSKRQEEFEACGALMITIETKITKINSAHFPARWIQTLTIGRGKPCWFPGINTFTLVSTVLHKVSSFQLKHRIYEDENDQQQQQIQKKKHKQQYTVKRQTRFKSKPPIGSIRKGI